MADSFTQIPKNLKDELAVRRFLASLLAKINELELQIKELTSS